MKDTWKFIPFIYIYFDLVAFSTVVAFNRFQERGFIHIVAFHRLALVRRGNNLGGISQYDRRDHCAVQWTVITSQEAAIESREEKRNTAIKSLQ